MKCLFIFIIIQFVTSNIFLVKIASQTYETNETSHEEYSSALDEKLKYGSVDYNNFDDENKKGLDEGDQSLNKSRIKDFLLKIVSPIKRELFLIGKTIDFCHFGASLCVPKYCKSQ